MALFSFFGKPQAFTTSDKLWMTKDEAIRSITTDALKSIVQEEIPFVVCFFESERKEMLEFFAKQNVPHFHWKQPDTNTTSLPDKAIICLDAEDAGKIPVDPPIDKSLIRFLFYGHYPLIAPEEITLQQLHNLTNTRTFTFYLSLDSPLLQTFGSDKIKSVMDTLGIKKDECIEHAMVSKSIQRAREKIALNIKSELKASSENDWFEKNVRKHF